MDIRVECSWPEYLLWALLCLTVPLDWIAAGIAAACCHELSHILTVWALGGRIRSVRIGNGGAVLDAVPMEPMRELAAILAGPAGSVALLSAWKLWPKAVLCGVVQGAFNLLPIYPLDGGRALLCVTGMLFSPETAAGICRVVRCMAVSLLFLMGAAGVMIYDLGIFPVLTMLFFLCRGAFGKIPCIADKLGVQ